MGDEERLNACFEAAESALGVPKLLDAADVVSGSTDALSMTAYVAKLRKGLLEEEEKGELSVHAVAAPRGGVMSYAAFAEAVRAAPPTARLLHLPARLRLTAVPAEARKAFDNYCELHKWPRRRLSLIHI